MNCINRSLRLILCLICSISFAQQISVNNTISPQNLIENTLIQGCVEVSNISSPSNGSAIGLGSFGYFERSTSNFPFENGIVLTTGNADSAGNGQNNAILNDGDDSWTTDSDLESALGITGTLNATSIEFDFISTSNQIQFNYILASEEYFGNFPCEYSDGFAFLIREAGSGNPYTNIALVPGTTIPVNTNTVHDEIVGFCDASNGEYFEGYNVGDTNYNGRTAILSATASIQPDVLYQIKLVIADQTDENYDSAVFIEGSSFSASVDLGEDLSTCASNILLDADIHNPDATYSWYFNNTLIPSVDTATFNAIQSGNYRVEIDISLSGIACIIEDDVNITISSTQSSDPISNYELCDDLSNDGIETFDLSTKDGEVLASVPSSTYTISYHHSDLEAQNGLNAITNPIQNITSPQLIYTRIEDTINGCLAFSTISLIVNPLPTIIDPTPLLVCDDQEADGFTTIDLSVKDDEITNGQINLVVTYHSSSTDAASGSNALPMPYVNTNINEQVFVSVRNPQTGCISTTTLDISLLDNPVINTGNHYIDACDVDHDGLAEFDLTSIIPEVLEGLTGVSVTFHESIEEALSGDNPIADDTNYNNITSNEQIVFIRVESDATGCASVTPIEIHTNLLLTATNLSDVSLCDIDNDDVEGFDFLAIAASIVHELEDITIEFYETEGDRDNQTNPIDQTALYNLQSNPQTIYITLESLTCFDQADIELFLYPVENFPSIGNVSVCDEDQDGFTTTDLSSLDTDVTFNEDGFSVTYFLTEQDAIDNTNVLPNLYTNVSNPFTLFPRISFDETGCSSINSFEVEVLPAPESHNPNEIIICDADRDGLFNINLTNSIPEVVASTVNRTITFHNTLIDADLDENSIINPSNYEAQTETIFIRIENNTTGCHSTQILNIIVNTLPYIGDLTNNMGSYNICENESDGIGEFVFETKDAEALDTQTGKEVSYYLNLNDATNKVNPINKTSPYQNISNPQTIFVRVDNITDETCFTTSSFTIEVGTNPQYNEPTDWIVCDDISNDGSEVFDFSTKVEEISAGFSDIQNVTFYSTEEDAINSTNPLPLEYANTVNPQDIFVQVDNGTICNSITSFVINVIQVPEVNPTVPIIVCDDDGDGFVTFDLTQTEIDFLDVRQDDIVINYYENFEDSELDSNPIVNPENYTNTSSIQTVYIKVTNTASNCYVTLPLELIVNLPPVINDFVTYDICVTDSNSIDLTDINIVAVDVNFNVIFSYFTNEVDAIANTNALDSNYTYQTNFDTLFVRAEYSTTHCFNYYEFNLNVNPLPIANQPTNLEACDDNFDGLLEFDLSQQNSSILNGQNATQFTVTYHNSELQAQESNSAIETNYFAFDSEIIYARVENNSTGCYNTTQFSVVINPLPVIDIEDQVICLDNLPLLVSANTNNPTDQYLWSTGETTPEIEITEIGIYSVTITSEFGCTNSRTFGVSESEAATIEVTEVVDFSDPNNITVTISGIGDYLYQLDDNEPQESNVFENVAMGYHTVTIIDLNGCSNVTKEVLVIDIPKFFTPNNDGDFDTWHIVGVETLPGTIINIFDRYGKHITQIASNTPGWDGFYNGLKLPASDYWFVADVKRGNISFQVKGHFTLRR
ncbi:T9SS type B sorting domain-containing protein [Winogradskyella sp. PG-2]|uniref:T9SS type B sorting domain-containing protein n=1 Tax=Winogradskyella sp. PG-2 TaxID=754409 RepID=UPI0005EFAACB|nr:choice-of-anchor L domain-containing protein [Winogradskyella sp. PG-2]